MEDSPNPRILIFLNGNLRRRCRVTLRHYMSLVDLISEAKYLLQIDQTVRCKLYDSNGGDVEEDDVEYLNASEPLFLSQGEDFCKESSLALYKTIRKLGQGGFGLVKLCKNRITKQQVAIKFVYKNTLGSPEEINQVYKEINMLRGLRHPNIVDLLDSFHVKDKVCFVMEYCSGGELMDYIHENFPLNESDVFSIAIQICEAMRYCHSAKIIHRDLKPQNVLLANKFSLQIKVADFGISGMYAVGMQGERSNKGSLEYIAPEMVTGEDNRASPYLDIWAIGCIIYVMLTGNRPFTGERSREIMQNIEEINYKPLPPTVSSCWHRLLRGIFRKVPQRRWNLLRIAEYLYKHRERRDVSSNESSIEEVEEEKKLTESQSTNVIKRGQTLRRRMKSPGALGVGKLEQGLCSIKVPPRKGAKDLLDPKLSTRTPGGVQRQMTFQKKGGKTPGLVRDR